MTENRQMRTKKTLLAVCCVIMSMVMMCGCVDVLVGACIGVPIMMCVNACDKCSAEPYPFIHEAESFDDVIIETVMLDWAYNEDTGDSRAAVVSVSVIDAPDNETFIEEFMQLRFTYINPPVQGAGRGRAFFLTWPDGQVEAVTAAGSALYTDRTLQEMISYNSKSADETFNALWEKWAFDR